MINLPVISSKQDLKLIKVTRGDILQVNGLEKFRLNFIIDASSNLYYFF